MAKAVATVLPEIFELEVDYGLPFDRMVALGRYDMCNSSINPRNFPVRGRGRVTRSGSLVQFSGKISSADVLKRIDKLGKRPATIEELLAFGARHPDIQKRFPVVAIGSTSKVDDFKTVAYLSKFDSRRIIHIHSCVGGWDISYRFLVFDKNIASGNR